MWGVTRGPCKVQGPSFGTLPGVKVSLWAPGFPEPQGYGAAFSEVQGSEMFWGLLTPPSA